MKFILFILPLLFIVNKAVAQNNLQFKTTSQFTRSIENYRWGDWSEEEELSVLINFDGDKELLTIYGSEKRNFNIIQFGGQETDEDGDDVWQLQCVDYAGEECSMSIVRINSQGGRYQLYIRYEHFQIGLNCVLIR